MPGIDSENRCFGCSLSLWERAGVWAGVRACVRPSVGSTLSTSRLRSSSLISDLFDAIRAGAVGYLNKSLAPDALIRALCGFLRGESIPMSRANAQKILDGYRARVAQPSPEPPPPNLTSREKDVLSLIARGARDREIAERLVVTESTVKKHVQNILRKMHARNRAEAAARVR